MKKYGLFNTPRYRLLQIYRLLIQQADEDELTSETDTRSFKENQPAQDSQVTVANDNKDSGSSE